MYKVFPSRCPNIAIANKIRTPLKVVGFICSLKIKANINSVAEPLKDAINITLKFEQESRSFLEKIIKNA